MPIYEYRCTECKHQLEIIQKISEPPLQICPKCHNSRLQKQISIVSFRLKGAGWYETDFKDKHKKNVPNENNDTVTTETKEANKEVSTSTTEVKPSSDTAL